VYARHMPGVAQSKQGGQYNENGKAQCPAVCCC
jgi:hypothetical protein